MELNCDVADVTGSKLRNSNQIGDSTISGSTEDGEMERLEELLQQRRNSRAVAADFNMANGRKAENLQA